MMFQKDAFDLFVNAESVSNTSGCTFERLKVLTSVP